MPLLMHLFNKPNMIHLKDKVFGVFDQTFSKKDPEGDYKWSTMRDLDRIWDDERCQKLKFNSSNTIVIDSEFCKVREILPNSIVVDPYQEIELLDEEKEDKTILGELKEYMVELLGNA